jgi:hypothetical protein
LNAGNIVGLKRVRIVNESIHDRRRNGGMRHAEEVPAFVKRDPLNIVCGPQIATIRIPGLSGVKHDIRFGHR